MDERIQWWFSGLESGLKTLPKDAPLFRACAENCLARGPLDFYLKLKADTGGAPDAFFAALSRIEGLDAEIVEPDRAYRLIFQACTCALHSCGYVNAPQLCCCSRASILLALQALWPGRSAAVEAEETILGGADQCTFRITLG